MLVRRAQSRINQATLENEVEDWDNARSGRPSRLPSGEMVDRGVMDISPIKTPDPFYFMGILVDRPWINRRVGFPCLHEIPSLQAGNDCRGIVDPRPGVNRHEIVRAKRWDRLLNEVGALRPASVQNRLGRHNEAESYRPSSDSPG